jgi:hypothetical protein
MVTWIEEWPSRAWIAFGCSPSAMSQAAQSWILHGFPTDSATAWRQVLPKVPHRRKPPASVVQVVVSGGGYVSTWRVTVSMTI